LDVTGKLKLVDKILLKFHQTASINGVNGLESSLEILSKNQLNLVSKRQKNIERIFPAASKEWANVNDASLYTILLKAADSRHEVQKNHNLALYRRLSFLKLSSLEREILLLRNVIDNIPSSIYWKDRDGFYLGHSGYAIQKLQATGIAPNITAKSIVGISDYDLFNQVTASAYRENDLCVMKNRKEVAVEEQVTTPKGEKLIQISSKKPLYDEKMEVVGVIGSTIDVTDCRRVEKLQQDKELAEKIRNAMEVLAGAMAHEVGNPLCSIELGVEKLEAIKVDPLEASVAATIINDIKRAIKRSSNIMDMLLVKLRSLVNPQIKNSNHQLCSIKKTIDEALDEYPFHISERQKISWNADSYQDFMYQGNSVLIKHVLFNLIKNALRATLEVERGQIYISLIPGDKVNSLIFKDTALGIEQKNMESLFLPFVSNSGSHGLGLAFCKITMESHGGSIACKSVYGEYTEFILSFPSVTKLQT
jgi:signal transduction histidine kinase